MVFFTRTFPVTIVRNTGKPDEQRQENIQAGGSFDYNILLQPEVGIKRGDEIHGAIFDEPRIATKVIPETSSSAEILSWNVEIVAKSEWEEMQAEKQPKISQFVIGNVGKLAGRDIVETNITAVSLIEGLEKAVANASNIPAQEKTGILEKLRDLKDNPYLVSIGSGAILEILKSLITG